MFLVLISAFLLALVFVPLSTKIAWKIGAIDIPTNRGSHNQPIPRLGGLGVVFATLLTLSFFLSFDSKLMAFLIGLAVVSIVGVIDDVHRLSARLKFFWQIVAALIFILVGDVSITSLGDIVGVGAVKLGWLSIPFTVLVMVGGINAINLSDGLDGLAAGLSVIAACFFVLFALHDGVNEVIVIAVALCGALLGFLSFNTHPAKLFMGDVGSLSLGFSLSALLILFDNNHPVAVGQMPLVSLVLALALPILDTLLVMGRRIYHGEPPFSPDKTHLHHRLLALNLPHPVVVSVMYVLMASFGLTAALLYSQPEWLQFAMLFVQGGLIFGVVIFAQHRGFDWKKKTHFKRPAWLTSSWIQSVAVQYGGAVTGLLLMLFFAPAIILPSFVSLLGWLPLMLTVLTMLAILFYRTDYQREIVGGIYVAIVVLLLEFNLVAQHDALYDKALCVIVAVSAVWVSIKLIYCERIIILFTTSFELLLLMVFWLIAFLMLPFSGIESATLKSALIDTCVESVPVFLLVKLHFSRNSGKHYLVLSGFAAALFGVWARSYFGF